jgi:hypothetical protein
MGCVFPFDSFQPAAGAMTAACAVDDAITSIHPIKQVNAAGFTLMKSSSNSD